MIRFHSRTLLFLLLFSCAGYTYFFVTSLISFPDEQLLHIYKTAWIFEEALRYLIEYLPVLTVSAVLLAFSTCKSENMELPVSAGSISKPVSRTLVLLLFVTLIYTALSIGLQPVLWEHRHNRLYSSSQAEQYLTQAKTAESEGRFETAHQLYMDYLSIDRDNREIKDSADHLEGKLALQKAESKAAPQKEAPPVRTSYRDMTIMELLEKAEQSLSDEDPFTAHYLAGIILDMDAGREDAKQIASRAMQAIESLEPGREQRKEYDIYQKKVKGYNELIHNRPIEAFYIFRELRSEVTADRDVETYYRESLEQTRRVSYFIDDALNTRMMPGVRKIVYIDQNAEASGKGVRSLVYIDKLVRKAGDFWAHGVEIMNFSPEEGELFHMRAQYAKLVDDTLLLKGIYRDDQTETIEPTIYSKKESPDIITIFKLSPTVVQLARLSREQDFLYRLNLVDLVQILPEVMKYGYPPSQFEILLLHRLLKPFLFLIISTLAIGIGWRLRIRGGKFPWLLIWVIPLLPFAIRLILYLIEYAHQIVLAAIVLYGGVYFGIAALIIMEAVLLFLSLLPIAMQKEL